jgi:hypothetical protein
VLADNANEALDLVNVEVRLGLNCVALLPIASLLGTRPRHRLTDDILPPQVHKK